MFYRLGQTCYHGAALLYRFQAANKLGVTACTSDTCMWLQPSDKKQQPAQLQQMVYDMTYTVLLYVAVEAGSKMQKWFLQN